MGALIILLIVVLLLCGLIFYYIRTKNQERLKMIEQGINPDEGLDISAHRKQTFLKNGILFISLGLGLITGHLLAINYQKLDHFIIYAVMLLFFGGIGFFINYMITKKPNL